MFFQAADSRNFTDALAASVGFGRKGRAVERVGQEMALCWEPGRRPYN